MFAVILVTLMYGVFLINLFIVTKLGTGYGVLNSNLALKA